MSERSERSERNVHTAPVAKRVPHVRNVHGDETVDDWYWLVDRDDPDTVPYLEAENAFTDAGTEHLGALRERLFEEIKARVQETDLSVPVRRGPWWYVTRTEEGKQYPKLCRRPTPDDESSEQLLLDGNELAGDSPYFAFGVVDVSPDHRLVAYSTDYDGNETLHRSVQGSRLGRAAARRDRGHVLRLGVGDRQRDVLLHDDRRRPPSVPRVASSTRYRRARTTSSCSRRLTSGSSCRSGSAGASGTSSCRRTARSRARCACWPRASPMAHSR